MNPLLRDALLACPPSTGEVVRAVARARGENLRQLAAALGFAYASVRGWGPKCIMPASALPALAEASRGTSAEVSLGTLSHLWWRDHAEAENQREVARRRARRAA